MSPPPITGAQPSPTSHPERGDIPAASGCPPHLRGPPPAPHNTPYIVVPSVPTPPQCYSQRWRLFSWCTPRSGRASRRCGTHGRASWPTSRTSPPLCHPPPSPPPPPLPSTPSFPENLPPCTSRPACPPTPRNSYASPVRGVGRGGLGRILWGSAGSLGLRKGFWGGSAGDLGGSAGSLRQWEGIWGRPGAWEEVLGGSEGSLKLWEGVLGGRRGFLKGLWGPPGRIWGECFEVCQGDLGQGGAGEVWGAQIWQRKLNRTSPAVLDQDGGSPHFGDSPKPLPPPHPETHRTVLNQILRQSTTHLADGPFAVLVDYIRVLDFDVKRKYVDGGV